MTDKELNSHDLAREIEMVKLQVENEELKSQLRGTTHCFDEEEHKKLKEEITNLSKDVDMWNKKYNDVFDENKRLKEALETKLYCKYANKCNELYDCSIEEYEDMAIANVRLNVENYDLQEENEKLRKQFEDRTEDYKRMKDNFDSKVDVLTEIDTQQKEFIKYLENEIKKQKEDIFANSLTTEDIGLYIKRIKILKIEEILNKYKEIVKGGNNNE